MGMRTNAVLTALNYFLDRKMEQEKQKREDERKLRNTEAMLRLQNDIAEYYNPGQRESREWANKASAGRNKNVVSNLADEDTLTKLNNANAISDALFNQEMTPVSQDIKRKDLNFKLANLDQQQELASGKLTSDLDDLNYYMQNKEQSRNRANQKEDMNLQLLAEQIANAKANRNLINMKAKAADEYAAIRKMVAENKINGGGRKEAFKTIYKGYDRLAIEKEKNNVLYRMSEIAKSYRAEGNENLLASDNEYNMLLDQFAALDDLLKDDGSTNSNTGLYNGLQNIFNGVSKKMEPYRKLIENSIQNPKPSTPLESFLLESTKPYLPQSKPPDIAELMKKKSILK